MIEIEYSLPQSRVASQWQLTLAEQVSTNNDIDISKIARKIEGNRLTVQIKTSVSEKTLDSIINDIEAELPSGSVQERLNGV